ILWNLSQHITQIPIVGAVPGALVWVALLAAIGGTVILAVVGIRLPGTNFNLVKYLYLNLVGYVPLLAMAPSILAGALTLGLYQQVQNAFDQVSSSFQFFARAWSTIVELLSIRKRLVLFESHIPAGSAIEHDPPLPTAEAGV